MDRREGFAKFLNNGELRRLRLEVRQVHLGAPPSVRGGCLHLILRLNLPLCSTRRPQLLSTEVHRPQAHRQ